MIVDITNEILTEITALLPTANVLSTYPDTVPEFPCVVVDETINESFIETVDTSGYKHSSITIQIDIFTQGDTRISEAKALRDTIDGLMNGTHRMRRSFAQPVPNVVDVSVYRYTLRYTFVADATRKIYRG